MASGNSLTSEIFFHSRAGSAKIVKMSESPIQALRQAFQAAGQAQVFRYYDANSADWSQEEKDSFIRDLEVTNAKELISC